VVKQTAEREGSDNSPWEIRVITGGGFIRVPLTGSPQEGMKWLGVIFSSKGYQGMDKAMLRIQNKKKLL